MQLLTKAYELIIIYIGFSFQTHLNINTNNAYIDDDVAMLG